MIITIISWLAVVCVLVAYASRRRRLYDVTNLIMCVPVALPAMIAGAWSSAAISLAFGLIGFLAWIEHFPAVHFRLQDLRDGIRYSYPPCCVLRYVFDRPDADCARMRGIVERKDGSRFVPCNVFHYGEAFETVRNRDIEYIESGAARGYR
jgi:hypothetical protein